jgi:putative flippase GtrA
MLERLWEFIDRYGTGFVAYFGVAFASALTEWGAFYISLVLMSPAPSALVGFVVATTVNFLLSRGFVFTPAHSPAREFFLVMATSALVFVANFAAFYLLYATGTSPLVAKICGTSVGFVFNYAMRQFVIFSRTSPLAPISTIVRFRTNRRVVDDISR